jgi:hypothetical protein
MLEINVGKYEFSGPTDSLDAVPGTSKGQIMTAQIIPFPTNRKSRTVERICTIDPSKATCEQIDEAMRELKTANGFVDLGKVSEDAGLVKKDATVHERLVHRFEDACMEGGACERCGEDEFSPNIEAFEMSGELLCDNCAEEVFEDNGREGVGA